MTTSTRYDIMGRKIICLAVIFLGMVATASTATACLKYTFGNNCEYQCHCAEGRACGSDGSCPNNRCDIHSGWEGEYCQREHLSIDAAEDYTMNDPLCSHRYTMNQDQPWWQVDLGKEYVLFTVTIWNRIDVGAVVEGRECKTTMRGGEYRGTMNTTRKGFTCDEWLNPNPPFVHTHKLANSSNYCRNPTGREPEPWCYTTETVDSNRIDYCNVPYCQVSLNNLKIWMNNTLCHHFNGTMGHGQTFDIRCDTPVTGRHLKIQLMDTPTVLFICEVTVRASQYRACSNKYYGPNCNNRCQCANDVKCDDKTGLCPNGTCNSLFTGPYCNIGILSVSKDRAATPTSIDVKWQFIIHDSADDAVKVEKIDLRYQESLSSSSRLVSYTYIVPRPGTLSTNITNLKPSTQYSFHIQLVYQSLNLKTGSVTAPPGPTANFQTESCRGYMVIPVIRVISNTIIPTGLTKPDRVALEIKAEVPGMIAGCKKELDVYVKKTNEANYLKFTKTDQTYTIRGLTAFTKYDIKATVRSPDGFEKDNIQKIRTAEDVPSAPSIAKAGASLTSVSIRITPPDPPYGIITKYDLLMGEAGSNGRTYSYGPANLTHTFNNLKSNRTYNFKAQAFTSAGGGVWSREISIITVDNIPGPPNTLLVQEHMTNSLVLAWTKPTFSNGIQGNYKVICTPLFSYDDEVNTKRMNYAKEYNPGPDVENITVSGLTPATEYNCSVAAQTSKGYGPSVWLRNWTKPEAPNIPESLFPNIAQDMTSDTTITVVIKKMPSTLKAGTVFMKPSSIRIGVEKIAKLRRRRSVPLPADRQALLTDYKTAKANGRLSYIAAELNPTFSGPFAIGDGKTYGGYYNAPLENGQEYDVIFGIVITAGEVSSVAYRTYGKPITVRSSTPEGRVVGLAVGLTIGILVILAAIIILAVIVRRRRAALLTTYERPMPMNDAPKNKGGYQRY